MMEQPTPEDLERDGAADLAAWEDVHREVVNSCAWCRTFPEPYLTQAVDARDFALLADDALPAWIRRALAAEVMVAAQEDLLCRRGVGLMPPAFSLARLDRLLTVLGDVRRYLAASAPEDSVRLFWNMHASVAACDENGD